MPRALAPNRNRIHTLTAACSLLVRCSFAHASLTSEAAANAERKQSGPSKVGAPDQRGTESAAFTAIRKEFKLGKLRANKAVGDLQGMVGGLVYVHRADGTVLVRRGPGHPHA